MKPPIWIDRKGKVVTLHVDFDVILAIAFIVYVLAYLLFCDWDARIVDSVDAWLPGA